MELIQVLFEKQVLLSENKIAIQHQTEEITYNDLNKKANRIADYLRKKGIKSEDRIIINLERSIDLIVAILGALKSGAAYVPVDAKYPANRLKYIYKDADPKFIITSKASSKLWTEENVIILDDFEFEDFSFSNPEIINESNNLAYIIYTSGSTGTPKGVMVEHKNAFHFLNWSKRTYNLDEKDVVVSLAPVIFDLSIFEIFAPLISGSKLIVLNKPIDIFNDNILNQVTLLSTVPSAFKSITAFQAFFENNIVMPNLNQFNFAGEKLDLDLVQKVYKYLNPKIIYNCYGPTETTTYATVFEIDRDYEGEIFIGKEITPTIVHILDDDLNELPYNEIGEIYISGECVTRGYLNLDEDSIQKFIIDKNNRRIYKTGDLGTKNKDGFVSYHGRIDDQVKIKGHRIELGEIESFLLKYDNIKQAVILPYENFNNTMLAAYILLKDTEEEFDIQKLREYLKNNIPIYMIPVNFIIIEYLPLTLSGKLDKNKLIKEIC
jgi:amino acid adenylation domain-containing protein